MVYVGPLSAPSALYASAEELASALRVKITAQNSDLLSASVAAASAEIEHFAGRDVADPIAVDDPLAHMVCLARGVEWYKSNDAAFGALGFDGTGVLSAPGDSFDRHARSLIPLVRSFGIA